MMKKLLVTPILVLSMMMLGFSLMPASFGAGSAGTVKMVNPLTDDSSFDYNTTHSHVPFTFNMRVILEPIGTVNVLAWQILLGFNATLLNVTNATLPVGHIFENFTYESPPPVIDNASGRIRQFAAIMSDSANISARVILTEITFTVMLSPTVQNPELMDAISFLDIDLAGGTYLIDYAAVKLDLSYQGGTFHYSYAGIGDLNGDGTVDLLDAILMGAAFGSTPSSPSWDADADINGDNIIDINDAILLASHYGEIYS